MHRRQLLAGLGVTAMGGPAFGKTTELPALVLNPALPPGVLDTAVLDRLAGKKPLIKLSYRPPNYETPLWGLRSTITANDQFFVRYHLSAIPEMDELRKNYTLSIGGDAAGKKISFTLEDLRREFRPAEVTAVCQCSGNRRGLFSPHVPGVQWGVGAMGNAVWSGVRLKDVLARAGVASGAVELGLAGADGPPLSVTPAFHKSLPIDKAMSDDVIIAFAMNHQKLPHYNGYPLRLIVPGWTATYWTKHLTHLEIRTKPVDSFWMQKAYRVPKGMFPVEQPFVSQETQQTAPITEIVVNSLITSHDNNAVATARGFTIEGVAWDRGHGIRSVEVSFDGGVAWVPAKLGKDLGHYSFRAFSLPTGKLAPGRISVMARATNNAGETQPDKLKFNPAGYNNNVPLAVALTLA